jgi:hypothetical protein
MSEESGATPTIEDLATWGENNPVGTSFGVILVGSMNFGISCFGHQFGTT